MFDAIPYWKDLPDLELYLDQVLLLINQIAQPNFMPADKGLTAAMVNNYVKHGYIDKPIKKKYQKHQVARLIAITFLKNTFSIQEISQVLNRLQEVGDSEMLYNHFVSCMRKERTDIPQIIQMACQTVMYYFETHRLNNQLEGGNHESDF